MNARLLVLSAALILTGNVLASASAQVPSTYTMRLKDAPIGAVAREVASITGKNIAVAPDVKKNMTLVSDHPLTASELYVEFVRALEELGYAAHDKDGVVRITPK
jgi:type II secretory pathway component GspD/PulD (secretin)